MESGIDPGQDYYAQDYYNYDHGYDLPQYGSRRKLISPSGLYDEYGEVVVDDDGSYYYSPQESDGEVRRKLNGGKTGPHPSKLQPRPPPLSNGHIRQTQRGEADRKSEDAKSKSSMLKTVMKHGNKKRRIKLVVDREYETSSTGEESMPESQRSRVTSALNSHANVNGSVYVAQNGSIIRTRRSANATAPAHTNNNFKLSSPVFSSRLAKHFKKLEKMAATLEERVPLNCPRTIVDGGCKTLSTFKGPASTAAASSFAKTDNSKTLNTFNTRQSSVSLGSSSTSNAGTESSASKSNLLRAAQGGTAEGEELKEGERESRVDGSNDEDDDHGLVMREALECPSDRTQSDEEELWMGPWNNLHIPMTKL